MREQPATEAEQLAIVLERCAHELRRAQEHAPDALPDLQRDAGEDLELVRDFLRRKRLDATLVPPIVGARNVETLAAVLGRVSEELYRLEWESSTRGRDERRREES